MTSSQTPQTDVGCPNLKDGDEVDADDLVLHLDQVDDGEDQVLQDLTFQLSGKVLDGSPCTPFDPAPLGLALHEAQGEFGVRDAWLSSLRGLWGQGPALCSVGPEKVSSNLTIPQ